MGITAGCLERAVSVHNSITLVPHKSLMHHDIQKVSSSHNFYLFFPICNRKEFKLFQLLESFKNKTANAPSIYQEISGLLQKIGRIMWFDHNISEFDSRICPKALDLNLPFYVTNSRLKLWHWTCSTQARLYLLIDFRK